MEYKKRLISGLGTRKILGYFLFLVLLVSFIGADTALCQTSNTEQQDKDKTEDQDYPKRMAARSPAEWLFSAPGLLINLPIKVVFMGVGGTVGFVSEKKLIKRVKYKWLTSSDGLTGVRPAYGSRGGAGLKFFRSNLVNEGSKFQISATAGLRSRQKYEMAFKRFNFFSDAVQTNIFLGYRMMSDERFFGVGPNSIESDETNYAREQVYADLGFDTELFKNMTMGVFLNAEQNNVLRGKNKKKPSTTDNYTLATLPGLENKVRMAGGRIEFKYDSRNSAGGPTSGQEISFGGGYTGQLDGSNYGFWKATGEIKQYIHLFYSRTIMLRVAGEATEPVDNKTVPFYHLSQIGSRETVRGYSRGRFRDLDMAVASIEYRFPVWKNAGTFFDGFLFMDAGHVAFDIFDIDTVKKDRTKVAYGGGFRLWNFESESLRLVLGKSEEQYRFYFALN